MTLMTEKLYTGTTKMVVDDCNRYKLCYKLLNKDATPPTRSHRGDLGYDLYSSEDLIINPHTKQKVSTGVAFQFPGGWGGFVKDRSSMAVNTTLETIGGVIDNGYTGELFIMMMNYGTEQQIISVGQKIAQMVLIPVANFDLCEIDKVQSIDGRNDNGFGSTGE